jgi:hypothetical protein
MRCFNVIPSRNSDKGFAVLVVNFVDGADVRMIESRGSFGFALEAVEGLRVFGYIIGKEFEGNEAVELHVFGFVDHSHAAAAELFYDEVVRDGAPDHQGANLTRVK